MLVLGWSVLLNVPLMVQYRWVDAPPNVTGSIFTVESSYARTYFHEEVVVVVVVVDVVVLVLVKFLCRFYLL